MELEKTLLDQTKSRQQEPGGYLSQLLPSPETPVPAEAMTHVTLHAPWREIREVAEQFSSKASIPQLE